MSHVQDPNHWRDAGPTATWDALAQWRAEGRRFVLASVVESRGFTPRKPGTHMLVDDAGETAGTIGGGAIEQLVVAEARALLEGGGTALMKKHLTQELGMCCGGEMSVFLEVLEPAPRLFLFGAGYIAKPLAALAAECGFRVTVVDERTDWAIAQRFTEAELVCREPEAYLVELVTTPRDYAVVVTHDHGLDQRLVQHLLRRPLKFVGLVGSLPKQRKFALRLRARGFTDAEIARLHCPLGAPIGAKTPQEIAVSVMAELIAVRRGASHGSGWVPPVRAQAPPAEDAGPVESSTESRTESLGSSQAATFEEERS
jgi:xanthine dehydrogenase accessory factor